MMEVYRGLPEGTQAELIDATIYISTSRVRAHQRTVAILSSRMILYAEEKEIGEVYTLHLMYTWMNTPMLFNQI